MTTRNEQAIITAIALINKQAAPPSGIHFESLETIFAGLSVLLACVALIIGLLQLRKHHKSACLSVQDDSYELEAGMPGVRSYVHVWSTLTPDQV
jgi:hypothetical protein